MNETVVQFVDDVGDGAGAGTDVIVIIEVDDTIEVVETVEVVDGGVGTGVGAGDGAEVTPVSEQ
jgi:hypothetical protein